MKKMNSNSRSAFNALIASKAKLVRSLSLVEARLERRYHLMTDSEYQAVCAHIAQLQDRLGNVNDQLMDFQAIFEELVTASYTEMFSGRRKVVVVEPKRVA